MDVSLRFNSVAYVISKPWHVAFDPKPFIRSFEAAVDKLISVRKEVQAKTEQMEKSVRVAEREYSKKMIDLTKSFEVGPFLCRSETRFHWTMIDSWSLVLWYGGTNERSQQHGYKNRYISHS